MRPDMNDKPGWYPASRILFCRGTACHALNISDPTYLIRHGGSHRQTVDVFGVSCRSPHPASRISFWSVVGAWRAMPSPCPPIHFLNFGVAKQSMSFPNVEIRASAISFCRGTACRARNISRRPFPHHIRPTITLIRPGGSHRQTVDVIPAR